MRFLWRSRPASLLRVVPDVAGRRAATLRVRFRRRLSSSTLAQALFDHHFLEFINPTGHRMAVVGWWFWTEKVLRPRPSRRSLGKMERSRFRLQPSKRWRVPEAWLTTSAGRVARPTGSRQASENLPTSAFLKKASASYNQTWRVVTRRGWENLSVRIS